MRYSTQIATEAQEETKDPGVKEWGINATSFAIASS